MVEWHKNKCYCLNCTHSWFGMTPDSSEQLECPQCRELSGGVAIKLYEQKKISIGKLANLLSMDMYEIRAFLKRRKEEGDDT